MNTDELNDLFAWDAREGDGAKDAETDAAIADVDIPDEESDEESADTAQDGDNSLLANLIDKATGYKPSDAQEAASKPSEAPIPKKDTPEPQKPQKPSKKPSAPTAEERMLEVLLKEQHPDLLKTALANGKTIRGAWKYVVSMMRNAYIKSYGRVNGGMCGNPDVVCEMAAAYLKSLPEGYTEPEVAPEAKKVAKPAPSKPAPSPAKKVEAVAKKAAKDAKKAADAKAKKVADEMQMLFDL